MMTATDEERLPILRVRGRDSGCDRNGDGDGNGEDDRDGDGDEGALYLDHQGERRSASNPRRAKGDAAATSQNRPRAPPGATPDAPPAAEAACAAAPSSSTPSNPRPHTHTHTPRHPPAPSKGSTSSPPSPPSSSPGPDDPNNPPAAVGAYLRQFQLRAVECVANAYDRSHCVSRTRASGALGTSLPEDVAFLFETQLSVLREYLRSQPAVPAPPAAAAAEDDNDRRKKPGPPSLWETRRGQELYCDATMSILECLIHTQRCAGPVFLTTLECCCEAANDLARLADKMDQMLASFRSAPPHRKDADDDAALDDGPVTARWNEYVALLSQDAVKAAERTHVFVIRDFVSWHQHGRHRRGHRGSSNQGGTAAPSALFSYQWEVECTNNEIITSLLEDVCDRDHWSRIRRYLDADVLRNKALVALCRAVVCYYVRCLVERADSAAHRGRRQDHHVLRRRAKQVLGMDRHRAGGFLHSGRALRRMKDDIALIKQYFVGKACGNATLTRILSNEVYILELIHECLEAAADLGEETGGRDGGGDGGGLGDDHGSDHLFLDSFIVVIHKRTGGDALVTRHFVGDLFMLVNHQERPLQLTVLQQDLHLVTMRMEEVKGGGSGGGGFGDPNKAKKKNAELSLVSVDQMLRAMYEDRIVQGMLPLCWTCLPKVEAEDGGMELVSAKIREITRGVADLRMKRKSSF